MVRIFPVALICTLTAPAAAPGEVFAPRSLLDSITQNPVELGEPDHGHVEHETSMLEYAQIDISVPTITGGLVQNHQSPELLKAANRAMGKWWAQQGSWKGLHSPTRATRQYHRV